MKENRARIMLIIWNEVKLKATGEVSPRRNSMRKRWTEYNIRKRGKSLYRAIFFFLRRCRTIPIMRRLREERSCVGKRVWPEKNSPAGELRGKMKPKLEGTP